MYRILSYPLPPTATGFWGLGEAYAQAPKKSRMLLGWVEGIGIGVQSFGSELEASGAWAKVGPP